MAVVDSAMHRDAKNVATIMAKKMTGQTQSGMVSYLPPGAIDPCSVNAASLNNGDITVTSQQVTSERPPALECVYTFQGTRFGESGTGQLEVLTMTEAQANAAVPATTVPAYFAASVGGSSMGGAAGYSTASAGDLLARGTTQGEPSYFIRYLSPHSRQRFIINLNDYQSSYNLGPGVEGISQECDFEISKMVKELLTKSLGGADSEASYKVSQDVFDSSLSSDGRTDNSPSPRSTWIGSDRCCVAE
jgi:hypothetical protein